MRFLPNTTVTYARNSNGLLYVILVERVLCKDDLCSKHGSCERTMYKALPLIPARGRKTINKYEKLYGNAKSFTDYCTLDGRWTFLTSDEILKIQITE